MFMFSASCAIQAVRNESNAQSRKMRAVSRWHQGLSAAGLPELRAVLLGAAAAIAPLGAERSGSSDVEVNNV